MQVHLVSQEAVRRYWMRWNGVPVVVSYLAGHSALNHQVVSSAHTVHALKLFLSFLSEMGVFCYPVGLKLLNQLLRGLGFRPGATVLSCG